MSYMTISSQENHHFSLCSYFRAHPTTLLLKILGETDAWAVPHLKFGGPVPPVPLGLPEAEHGVRRKQTSCFKFLPWRGLNLGPRSLIVIVIIISRLLKRYSKAKRARAPAYSRALRRIKGGSKGGQEKLRSDFQNTRRG